MIPFCKYFLLIFTIYRFIFQKYSTIIRFLKTVLEKKVKKREFLLVENDYCMIYYKRRCNRLDTVTRKRGIKNGR